MCKVGSGFSDEALASIHAQLKELEIERAPDNLKYREKNIDTWVQP